MKNIQKEMQQLLADIVGEGRERGIQLAVYHRGELIVDAWAGIADNKTGRKVDGSTLFPVFSTTKGIAATIIHLLADLKELDYDLKISSFWPEFGVNGKEGATIRHALNHTTGIPHMPEALGYEDIVDWNKMCDKIAKLTPQWVPGIHMEYHAITFSWIIGEIARRIDGRPFSQIMHEEICMPLGIEDMYVGIPDAVESRVAILEEPEFDLQSAVNPTAGPQSIPSWIMPLHEWMNRQDARRACIPASNGIMSAKAIARHYAALLPGGVDGVELLSPARIKLATKPVILQDGIPLTMSMGYSIGAQDSIMGPHASTFGHGGYGGSIAFADPVNHLAVGLVNNLYSKNGAGFIIINELKKKLGIPLD
ncbi:class A beta-lactamase-related serine hydrolase [Paenibacillus psychroresistens]|uniref:Class A beta-lactamase-related serine hydrolase n=1 Tax=Paenibacillus psychroresistens TaxID=1778678 RepID=A0A6B8RFG1_9BACL|nr:serine hydrolase domain-containing protein [Paenibacillus psychroresistens]QGQ95231.1 class A beta-lactamase-related serine hydrolase [Paenibacillus psychroresistens]